MGTVGTAHDALVTRCRATLPGHATRSASRRWVGSEAFRSPDGGRSTEGERRIKRLCSQRNLSAQALVDQKIDRYGCAGPRLSAGAHKAQCDDAEARFLVRHHNATRVSVRSARSHTHSEKRFPRICAGLVRIASSSKARPTVKPAAMLKTRIGGARSPSA